MFTNQEGRIHRFSWALLVVASVFAVGCGDGGPNIYTVSGTVSYAGKAIEEGRILFRNTGGDGRGYSGEIKNGAYQVKCEVGKMKVEVIATRIIPGKFKKGENGESELQPVGEMYIPAKYNTKTTLTADVNASSTTFPFDLPK